MKFAHIADCHIGGWREPKLRDLNEQSFIHVIDTCITENVDFVIIAGDLFNTAFPAIDSLRVAVEKIKELNDKNIPVYVIPGSHDSSASGKTIIDVLESAGLVTNVCKGTLADDKLKLSFTIDKKTGTKITGLLGKRGGLETAYYKQLSNDHLETEDGYKIFLFHSALEELKHKDLALMDAMSASMLPKHFNYYAGGHVHIVDKTDLESRKNIVYPGPVFPNSFSELEKLRNGSFCIIENEIIRHIKIALRPILSFHFTCDGKNPPEIEHAVDDQLSTINPQNALITLRFSGRMREGKISDINFKTILTTLENKGAYTVLKNTNNLTSPEFEAITVAHMTTNDIEDALIKEHAAQHTLFAYKKDCTLIKNLLHELSAEKNEAEKNADFEKRIITAIDNLISDQTAFQK